MNDALAARLAQNLRQLREARGLTQKESAALSRVPRATWANLESGTANPTLGVLDRVAHAFQVTLEELVSTPRAACAFYPKARLPVVRRGEATVRKLLPDPLPGMEIDRFELPAGVRMVGVPHTPGTREYLTCEAGSIELVAAGEAWTLAPGDVVAFRGDQRHSYANRGRAVAVAYSVVRMAR
jgi:transcriptional regulator with XRE-family HTH domain